jgi:hypothetical protein
MKRSSLLLGAFCALAIGASSVQAQNKLTTIFASNNGGSVGGIVYFDVTVSSAVIINAFETNCDQAASTPIGLDVYTIPTPTSAAKAASPVGPWSPPTTVKPSPPAAAMWPASSTSRRP